MLIRRSSGVGSNWNRETYFEAEVEDVIETHEWRCVRTVNGTFPSIIISIFMFRTQTYARVYRVMNLREHAFWSQYQKISTQRSQAYGWDGHIYSLIIQTIHTKFIESIKTSFHVVVRCMLKQKSYQIDS